MASIERTAYPRLKHLPVTTTKIRVNITGSAGDNYAYLTEVEALGDDAPPQQSAIAQLIVTNDSNEPIAIGSIESAAPFSITLPAGSESLPVVLNVGASLTLTVKFTPTTIGLQTGMLTLRDTSGEPLLSVELRGEGIQN